MSSNSQSQITEDVYKKFNKSVKEFLKELMKGFPAIKELKFVYAGYKLVKSFGKKLVQRYWDEAVGTPYGVHIREKSDAFFMDPNFALPKGYQFYSNYIPVFQSLWSSLDENNKNAIWNHLQVILYLNQECKLYRQNKVKDASLEDDDSEKQFKACCKELHVQID